ncbi:unnamed protein product [Phaedon cochleariae]|uniref:FAM234A/B beta-propeller domain-containing protein n=1 Tax=Phaedon cochleariae TaxID=80249 RepID=A0A9P0DRC4_PHACE|nr:unnamed protein product [Phaedon cochleariae]
MSSHSMQGVYAPLPQSLSDSDSEKEGTMGPIHTNGIISSNHKLNNFACRKNGHNLGLGFNINDDVHHIKRITPKMTALRKTAFVFSILLCFLPIVIFLWILPCSDSNTCPMRIPNYETNQEDIELLGTINLVHGAFENNWNFALMYKGSFNSEKSLKNGIMSFVGTSGNVAWYFQQESHPFAINCSIIDVDGNGYDDCLVVDEKSLKAIQTQSGEALWHAHSSEEELIPELDMPVKIPDFDNDGVSDLLAAYRKETFLVISGKSGLALSNIRLPSSCSYIFNLRMRQHDEHIKYGCKKYDGTEVTFEFTLDGLKKKYKNPHDKIELKEVKNDIAQTVLETGTHKLIVENQNHCPHCEAVISLYNSNNTTLGVWTFQNAIVLTPVPFSLHRTKENTLSLKGHLNGFIFKIWKWQENSRKLSPVTKVYKRSIPVHNETYHLNEVSERVVLITLRENDTQIENVSVTDIYLICNGPEHDNCQPDYKNQQNSLLIADLDHDDSLELVSYHSTYLRKDEDGYEAWHLVSRLKVFRLENELPKLFGKN